VAKGRVVSLWLVLLRKRRKGAKGGFLDRSSAFRYHERRPCNVGDGITYLSQHLFEWESESLGGEQPFLRELDCLMRGAGHPPGFQVQI